MVLHKTNQGNIQFNADTRVMDVAFEGFMSAKEFRDFMTTGLNLLTKKLQEGNVLWLADTRNHKVVKKEETDWVAQFWTPEAKKAGLTHIAFIVPKDVFAEMSVTNYQKQAQNVGGILIKNFDDPKKAVSWYLESVQNPALKS